MHDFQLKLILSILGGVVFSFIFIILAFALPLDDKTPTYIKKPQGLLEKVSDSVKKK
ncbi:MAG: hypothetical protein PHS42_11035 [Sulfurimonas sp.]|nr:hypothetical protein [Sulfurimonas sp.]